jgi:hypothetical protein
VLEGDVRDPRQSERDEGGIGAVQLHDVVRAEERRERPDLLLEALLPERDPGEIEHAQIASKSRTQRSVGRRELSPPSHEAREVPDQPQVPVRPRRAWRLRVQALRTKSPVRLAPAVGGSGPQSLVRVEDALELRVLPLGLAEDPPLVAERVGFHARPPQELRVDVGVVGDVADVEDAQGLLSGRDGSRQR